MLLLMRPHRLPRLEKALLLMHPQRLPRLEKARAAASSSAGGSAGAGTTSAAHRLRKEVAESRSPMPPSCDPPTSVAPRPKRKAEVQAAAQKVDEKAQAEAEVATKAAEDEAEVVQTESELWSMTPEQRTQSVFCCSILR